MNFLAHAAVARRLAGDDAEFVWGAALPDLVAMLGPPLNRADLSPRAAEGWRAHHRMDEVFHANPVFLDGVRSLHADLDGLGRGPRRAVAHVGWELLLDDAVEPDAFRLALTVAPDDLAARLTGAPPPLAERVWRAVARRPRLAFDHDRLDHVAAALDAHAPAVAAVADEVLTAVLGALEDRQGP